MWRKRCLVILPVLVYVVTALLLSAGMASVLLSCGSSSGNSTPEPTVTPVALIFVRVCQQPTVTPSPSPTATPSSTPTATPSPTATPPLNTQSCAQATSFNMPTSSSLQIYAQGQYNSNGVNTYANITSSVSWFSDSSVVASDGGGLFSSGPNPGCACITAAAGSLVSPPVRISVGGSVCTPCPSP